MTGQQFEKAFCEILQSMGYWALNIPKNASGAQPFDVIAIHGFHSMAIDCKVCKADRFPVDRIEDNQWAAFNCIYERADNCDVGIMVYHDGDIYFFKYKELKDAVECGWKSLPLKRSNTWNLWMTKEEVKDELGRYLE